MPLAFRQLRVLFPRHLLAPDLNCQDFDFDPYLAELITGITRLHHQNWVLQGLQLIPSESQRLHRYLTNKGQNHRRLRSYHRRRYQQHFVLVSSSVPLLALIAVDRRSQN